MNSVLNVLLTAGVLSVILNAIITSVLARNARKKELQGLLRMLYVEIEVNRGQGWRSCSGPLPNPVRSLGAPRSIV